MSQPRALATLWIGPALSFLEVLCLRAMLRHGHRVVLYSYQDVANVPDGVEQRDAREVLDAGCIWVHGRTLTPAIHADLFRLEMLAKTDHLWVDADLYPLGPLPLDEPHLFAWEKEGSIGNSVLGLPRDSAALAAMRERVNTYLDDPATETRDGAANAFGTGLPARAVSMFISELGPRTVTAALKASGEIAHARRRDAFYPVTIGEARLFCRKPSHVQLRITPETLGLHMWSWRLDKVIARQDPERLAQSWLGRACAAEGVNIDDFPMIEVADAIGADAPEPKTAKG